MHSRPTTQQQLKDHTSEELDALKLLFMLSPPPLWGLGFGDGESLNR